MEGINYRTRSDWEQIVLDLTSGRGVDHLINTAGGESLKKCVTALAYDGHIALIGFLEGLTATIEILPLMVKRARLHGVTVGHRRAFEAMNGALERFQLKPIIDGVYSFDEASAAFEHLSKGAFGKIVISCQQALLKAIDRAELLLGD